MIHLTTHQVSVFLSSMLSELYIKWALSAMGCCFFLPTLTQHVVENTNKIQTDIHYTKTIIRRISYF